MTAGRRWSTIGVAPVPGPGFATAVVAAVVAVVPVFVQFNRLGYPDETITPAMLTLLALAVIAHVLPKLTPMWAAVAFLLVARDGLVPPVTVGLAVAVTLLWAVATGALAGIPRRATRSPVSWAAIPGLLIAAILLIARTGVRGPAAGIGLAVLGLAVAAGRPDEADRVARLLEPALHRGRRLAVANEALIARIGRPLGAVLGAIGMLPAALVTSVVWAGHRVVRYETLAPPSAPGSRWVARGNTDATPWRATTTSGVHPAGGHGIRRVAAGVAAAMVVIIPISVVAVGPSNILGAFRADECSPGETNVAMGDDPAWPDIGCVTTDFASRGDFDAATVYTFPDFSSRWINETGGIRQGWQPPECADCRRLRVWWFGGSAAWGWWQRDDFTLPSQLAKWAAERGIVLDVTNYAMPGWVLGQSVRRFSQLTATEPLPDLVIFYDGGNDLNRQKLRDQVGRGDDESETSFAEFEIDRTLRSANDPEVAEETTTTVPESERTDPAILARHAVRRYLRSVDLATRISAVVGIEPVFLWQPLAPGVPAAAANADAVSPADRTVWDTLLPAARALLPETVLDLSDTFDDTTTPVFSDIFHTNEHGADLVAQRIVERLDPVLQRLASTPT